MDANSIPVAENGWYYLKCSRQVGPYSSSELCLLLANNVLTQTDLVWRPGSGSWRPLRDITEGPALEPQRPKSRRTWVVAPLSIAVLFGGIAIAVETEKVLAVISKVRANQQFSYLIHAPIRVIKLAKPASSGVNGDRPNLADFRPRGQSSDTQPEMIHEVRANVIVSDNQPQPISSNTYLPLMNAVRPSFTPQTSAQASRLPEASTEGQFVQEFWRSMASSNVVDRYELYLRRFPFGAFADTAAARITELHDASEILASKRKITVKNSKSLSRTTKPTLVKTAALTPSAQQAAGRCRNGNTDRCINEKKKDCVGPKKFSKKYKACVVHNYQSTTKAGRYAQ